MRLKITRKRAIIAGAGVFAVIAATVTTGCTNQLNDLRNAGQQYPSYASTVLNVDGFPNVTILCIKGAGFATTTRDLNAILRVPEWDAFCATQVGHTTPTNPNSAP